jgi:hypothetical protein
LDNQLSQSQQSNVQLHIGELAQASGATTKSFRHYEDGGLLPLANPLKMAISRSQVTVVMIEFAIDLRI